MDSVGADREALGRLSRMDTLLGRLASLLPLPPDPALLVCLLSRSSNYDDFLAWDVSPHTLLLPPWFTPRAIDVSPLHASLCFLKTTAARVHQTQPSGRRVCRGHGCLAN